MIVTIAGYNIDRSLIEKLGLPQQATPETISAAYARISRSSKTIAALREQAIKDVGKARQSNEKIVFDMGHSSIAEHAVFNFDLIGISRYLTEFIQKSRLASFTEKSQRYVTWDSDYVTPSELEDGKLKDEYTLTVKKLFSLYAELYHKGIEHYSRKHPETGLKKREEMAKEDARYVLPLATGTQMGVTLNARSLEKLLRRLSNIDLLEAKKLYDTLLARTKEITPSLIRYVEPDPYCESLKKLGGEMRSLFPENVSFSPPETKVKILNTAPEDQLLAGLLFQYVPSDFDVLLDKIGKLPPSEKKRLFNLACNRMSAFNQPPRAFELVDCLIQTSVSSSCFAQIKRHRMATIIRSEYHPDYGYVIPEIFRATGSHKAIARTLESLKPVYEQLEEKKRGLGSYILTNAHKVNLLFKTNLRELYHFSRLRSDSHAQWEIRELSQKLEKKLKELMPNAARLMMGKDSFPQL